ncbi:MAG TPA: cobalamin-dependent protein [Vicinamibacterales bacterium]|jgi:5-methyltetrahydrofolate--homocysteine methyltransferase
MRADHATAYHDAVFDTDREQALAVVQRALDDGVTPEDVVFTIVIPSLEKMAGGLVTDSLVTLSQHFLSAKIAEEVTDALIPRFTVAPEIRGHVVIGTSFGDFHGLGKKILSGCLKAKMFQVTDIGLNAPPERFVDEALAQGAQVIAVSSMMVHTALGERGPRRVRALLRERELEGRIKIVVGGAPYRFHENLYRDVEADGWGATAIEGTNVIARLIRDGRLS